MVASPLGRLCRLFSTFILALLDSLASVFRFLL